MEIEKATQKHYDGLSSEQEYRQQLMDIQNEYYDQVLSSSEISEERKLRLLTKNRKRVLKNLVKIMKKISVR